MILIDDIDKITEYSCPHTRGDDPSQSVLTSYSSALVSIRVGMILTTLAGNVMDGACPHTRGDDPLAKIKLALFENLSPYAWG